VYPKNQEECGGPKKASRSCGSRKKEQGIKVGTWPEQRGKKKKTHGEENGLKNKRGIEGDKVIPEMKRLALKEKKNRCYDLLR
jgi:hypothetical protein